MILKNNEIYRHFKGNLYKVITIATHSETGEQMVVYQALYDDFAVYCRPLDMFLSSVDREKYPDVTQKMRFEPVKDLIYMETNVLSQSGSVQQEELGLVTTRSGSIISEGEMRKTGEEFGADDVIEEATWSADSDERNDDLSSCPENEAEESQGVDPLILEFLDAETIAEKRNILTALHHRITDQMINTLAVVMDVVIEEGDLEDRYYQLKNCLVTKERYEIERK